ncbi:MAG: hypothetical protein PHX53_04365 [Syntrophales bacterium]|nr:hypothetical protein [Syntrophales bacterium]
MKRRLAPIFACIGLQLFFSPPSSLAAGLQCAPPGPYVNEIAHLLFLGAMIFFIYEILHAGLKKFRGFRFLLWAWALLALWNLDAFVGHWAAWTCAAPLVLGDGWSSRLLMKDFRDWTVLVTQLNNFLLLVPAFYLFYRGLKALAQMPRTKHQ